MLPGNESNARHHTSGVIEQRNATKDIQIRVPENADSFPVLIWVNPTDRMSVSIKSPIGEIVPRIPAEPGLSIERRLTLERAIVTVEYFFPIAASGVQLIDIRILNPTPGIWIITLYGDIILEGRFNAWLHMTGLISPGIEFLIPDPYTTITVPATTAGGITCGAYNDRDGSLFPESSWGPNRVMLQKPDLVAPGVNVTGVYPIGNGTMTGTSVSTAITAGACALMLQWGIVEQNSISLNTFRIKSFLIRGCRREQDIQYPNYKWGFGKLDLFNTFRQLIP